MHQEVGEAGQHNKDMRKRHKKDKGSKRDTWNMAVIQVESKMKAANGNTTWT